MAPGMAPGLPFEQVLGPVMAEGGGALVAIMHSEVEATGPALAVARRHWPGPLGAYAHSGAFADAALAVRGIITPAAYLAEAERWVAAGVQVIGGCCGIGPDHIRLLAERLPRSVPPPRR